MDYHEVDIVVVLDSNGNLDEVYTLDGRGKVAVLDWHYDDQDAIRDSVAFSGMPRDAQEKFEALINAKKRHYHFGCESRVGDKRIHRDIENALVELRAALEEADAKIKEDWFIYPCTDSDCEGIIE
jgi:hypothetical protein